MPPITEKSKREKDSQKNSRGRPRKENSEAQQPKAGQIHRAVIKAFECLVTQDEKRKLSLLPKPDQKIAVYRNNRGQRVPLLVSQKDECVEVDIDRIAEVIAGYLETLCAEEPYYALTDHGIMQCAKLWLKLATEIIEPTPFLFIDETGYTFQRLPFKKDATLPTPKWNEWCARIDDPEGFLKFIWAVFTQQAYKQQAFIIRGNGGDGKGVIGRVLKRLLGHKCSTRNTAPQDKFWGCIYENKWLVVYLDQQDPNFVRDPVFMASTGADYIQVEHKGKDVYDLPPTAMTLMFMNVAPNPLRRRSDLRRLLYSEIQPLPKDTILNSAYDAELFDELGGVLARAEILFQRDCVRSVNGKELYVPIEQPKRVVERLWEMSQHINIEFDWLFDEDLSAHPKLKITKKDSDFVSNDQLKKMLSSHPNFSWLNESEFNVKFREFSLHVQDLGAIRCKGRKGERGYSGIRALDFGQTMDAAWTDPRQMITVG